MTKQLFMTLCGVWLAAFAAPAGAETVIGTWSGEGSATTPEFEVQAPWILDWRTTGELSRVVAVDVSLVDAATGAYQGTVLRTKTPGNGVRLFEKSGRFYFRVDGTLMGWHLKVVQLTEKEAEAYKPKSQSLLNQ